MNKMGVMPVGKLVWNMSLPMMISMLVQALYNIVDSIFVSQINENALTAVSMAFPLQTLIIAVGAGTGVGINALVSKALGEGKPEKANQVAANGGFLYAMSFLAFLGLSFLVVKPFYYSQLKDVKEGAEEIFSMGTEYLFIVMAVSVGIFGQFFFERLLISTGKTVYSMISQLSGAVTNIIMDPILIFGWLFFPKMGVAGAAVATVLGQCVSCMVAFFCNRKYNKEIHLQYKGFHPEGRTILSIYLIGIPSIIMQSIGSIMTYSMNKILIGFSSTAVAVFGVYFKLQSFFFMPIFGMNNGITPIIAFSYGAKLKKRMLKAIKISMEAALGLMLVGFISFECFPGLLLKLFKASDEMLSIGCPALRTIGFHYLLAWFCIISGTIFQALGKAFYSMIVSIMRQLVVLIPAALLLAKYGGLKAVWWSFPIAELMSFVVSAFFLIRIYHTTIKPLAEGHE